VTLFCQSRIKKLKIFFNFKEPPFISKYNIISNHLICQGLILVISTILTLKLLEVYLILNVYYAISALAYYIPLLSKITLFSDESRGIQKTEKEGKNQ
jgi:hypothetical protein